MRVAIDASRSRSGGAKAHLLGIINDGDPTMFGITEVHIWSYSKLLDALPDKPWLIKHGHPFLERGLMAQLFWQKFLLKKELRMNNCKAMLSTDAGTVSDFNPSVVMSRDMLSFESGEMQRFNWTIAWIRLLVLRYVQIASLRAACGQLFLTDYAANIISSYTARLSNIRVIPHGISDSFRAEPKFEFFFPDDQIVCVYVSNADLYKHQWVVIEAISLLRQSGVNITLKLLGAAEGREVAMTLINSATKQFDPKSEFVEIYGAIDHAKIPIHLRQSNIFIFASSCENMPNTLVEGMASGIPIVCSSRGPMPEILQDGGLYFDPEDVNSIVSALRTMVSSEEIRHSCVKKAKMLSENFSWARCAKETWSYLSEVAYAGKN